MQGNLFALGSPKLHPSPSFERRQLDDQCWVDVSPGWLLGADELLIELIETLPWKQRRRQMWGNDVLEPRLSAGLAVGRHRTIASMARALRHHYGESFDAVFCNYYRNGSDGVAWHADRIGQLVQPRVAIVSLGGPRRFLLRPKGGGASRRFDLVSGDLLVMGGRCQHRFEHKVPKVAHAEPRISVTLRRKNAAA